MLDPNYIADLAEGSEEVSARLHDSIIADMIARLTARLGRGEEIYLTATDKWQADVLQEAGYLLSDIQKDIAKAFPAQKKEIKKAFEDAGIKQLRNDAQTYKNAGIDIDTDITQSATYIRILQAAYERAVAGYENFTGTTLARAAYAQFVTACNDAYMKVTTGAEGWNRAFMDAVDNISNNGVEVVYPTGHRDTIETATLRAVRTGVAQACGKVTAARAADNGVHLFLTSAHQGARPTHVPWQGKVFWVDWDELAKRINLTGGAGEEATPEEKAKYREFCRATDIGTVTGLEGVNCRHSYGAYFEGMTNPYENMKFDPKQYEIDQRARLLERRIRKTKRALLGYETAKKNTNDPKALADIDKAIKAKTNVAKRQISTYYDYCKANNIKPQEARIHIGN